MTLQIQRTELPLALEQMILGGARGLPGVSLKSYRLKTVDDDYTILLGREPVAGVRNGFPEDLRWHVSVAGKEDVPPWVLMVEIAHHLRPAVVFVLGVPPRSWWLNVHPHTLHLWQLDDDALERQWRGERLGHTPS